MDELTLQQLRDKDAIRELRWRFAQALDTQNWDLATSLFMPEVDADFTVWGVPPQRVPREALIQSFRHNLSRPGLKTQHVYTNFRITVDGDRALCLSYQVAQHYLKDFPGGEEFVLRAEYKDALTRTPDGWQIDGITLTTVFFTSGNANILAS